MTNQPSPSFPVPFLCFLEERLAENLKQYLELNGLPKEAIEAVDTLAYLIQLSFDQQSPKPELRQFYETELQVTIQNVANLVEALGNKSKILASSKNIPWEPYTGW